MKVLYRMKYEAKVMPETTEQLTAWVAWTRF